MSWKDIVKKLALLITALFVIDLLYLLSFLPSIISMSNGHIPESKFIAAYKERLEEDKNLPPLRWAPLKSQLPPKEENAIYYRRG